jgi:hypothetical protein
MRPYQHTAISVLDRYILCGGHKSDAGVCSGRRRRFLVWISLLHIVVKPVRNRTGRFRYVFGSADGYGI